MILKTMNRVINDHGLDLLKELEGCRLNAYQDPCGIWTIGFGHTRGVRKGQVTTVDESLDTLHFDLIGVEAAVHEATLGTPTTDNQFSAMVVFAYNVGIGNFRTSSVRKLHEEKKTEEAADAFLLWDKAHVDGELKSLRGLELRRRAERDLYLTPDDEEECDKQMHFLSPESQARLAK